MPKRIKQLTITGELLLEFLKDGRPAVRCIKDPLPDDARIVQANMGGLNGWDIVLIIRSESFPEWDPLKPMPTITPMYERA